VPTVELLTATKHVFHDPLSFSFAEKYSFGDFRIAILAGKNMPFSSQRVGTPIKTKS
jgi:hypothetical protein